MAAEAFLFVGFCFHGVLHGFEKLLFGLFGVLFLAHWSFVQHTAQNKNINNHRTTIENNPKHIETIAYRITSYRAQ
jgi:hypothetical protein